MGWLRLVGSLKLKVSSTEYSLFCRALLQKRPIIKEHMGWLRLVGSLKLKVYSTEYSLFCRALLQKRPIIKDHMGCLRLVGSLKLKVSSTEYSLFCRALLQKRHIILRSLLIVATPYMNCPTLNARELQWTHQKYRRAIPQNTLDVSSAILDENYTRHMQREWRHIQREWRFSFENSKENCNSLQNIFDMSRANHQNAFSLVQFIKILTQE